MDGWSEMGFGKQTGLGLRIRLVRKDRGPFPYDEQTGSYASGVNASVKQIS